MLITTITTFFLLTGCEELNINNSLLCPVKIITPEYEILETLKNRKYKKPDISLVKPNSKGSVITSLKNDSCAAIFYKTTEKNLKNTNDLTMAIFYKDLHNKWRYYLDIPLTSESLDCVFTIKNLKENSEFLIVGAIKNNKKICYIYDCSTKNLKKLYSFNYKYIAPIDIKLDGNFELFVISKEKQKSQFQKENIVIDENANKAIEESIKNNEKKYRKNKNDIALVMNISKNCININLGTSFEKFDCKYFEITNSVFNANTFSCPCLFLDTQLKKTYYTISRWFLFKENEIIYDFQFNNPYSLETPRAFPFFYDVDSDKKIEFPHTYLFEGYNLKNTNKLEEEGIQYPQKTLWFKYNYKKDNTNGKFKIEKNLFKKTYSNYIYKYAIELPEKWLKNFENKNDKVSAKYLNENQDIEFFVYKENKDSNYNFLENDKEKLLTIKVDYIFKEREYEKNDFFVLHVDGKLGYFAKIHENLKISNPELKLTKKEVKDMFFTFNN